jgi:hypothetical protein
VTKIPDKFPAILLNFEKQNSATDGVWKSLKMAKAQKQPSLKVFLQRVAIQRIH